MSFFRTFSPITLARGFVASRNPEAHISISETNRSTVSGPHLDVFHKFPLPNLREVFRTIERFAPVHPELINHQRTLASVSSYVVNRLKHP